jgi:hypothetical protein
LELRNENNWKSYVTVTDVLSHGGRGLFNHYSGINEMFLNTANSSKYWNNQKPEERKGQSWLQRLVQAVYQTPPVINYQLKSSGQRPFELDVYIPELSLAFEYQGEQHFKSTVFGNMEWVKTQQTRVLLHMPSTSLIKRLRMTEKKSYVKHER